MESVLVAEDGEAQVSYAPRDVSVMQDAGSRRRIEIENRKIFVDNIRKDVLRKIRSNG